MINSFPTIVLSFVHSYLKNLKHDSYGLKATITPTRSTENAFRYSKNIYLSSDFLKNDLLNGELDVNLIRNNRNQLVNGNLKGELALTSDENQSLEIGFMQSGLNNLMNKFIDELSKKSVNLQGTIQEILKLMMSLRNDKQSMQTILDTTDEDDSESIRLIAYLNLNKKTIFLVDFDADSNQVKSNKLRRSIDLNSRNKSILSKYYERAFVFIYLNKGYELSNPLSPIKFEITGVSVFGMKFNNQTLSPTFINDFRTSVEIGSKQEHKLKFYSGLHLNPTFNYVIKPVNKDYLFNLYMPNHTISLIRSTTFLGEHSVQDRMIDETKGRPRCTSTLNSLIGVELCMQESVNTEQPIQKLILYEIYLKKTDLSFESWQTIFTIDKQVNNRDDLYNIVVLFDTPGSTFNRHLNSKLQLRKSTKNISLNGTFSNQIQQYSVNLNVNTNDVNNMESKLYLYSGDQLISIVDFIQTIQHFKTKSEYKPSLRVFITPTFNRPTIHLTGSLVVDLVNKNNLQFGLYSKTANTQYVKGLIKRTQNEKYLADILLNLPGLINVRLSSNIQYLNNQYLSTETKLDYILYRLKLQDTIKISTKYRNTSFNALTGLSTFVNMRCTRHSNFNFDLAYNLTYKPNSFLENDFKFQYLNIKEINLFQQYTFTRSPKNGKWFTCENQLKINLQPQQLTYQSQIGLVYHPATELFQYKLDFNLDKVLNQLAMDMVKFNFDYQQVTKKPLKTYLKTSIQYKTKLDVSYKDELEEVAKNEFKGQTMLKWSKSKFVRLDYNYLIRNDFIGKFYKINTDFQMHHMPDPYTHQALFEYQKNNFTVRSLFKIKDRALWNFNMFTEYRKQFNLTLESDYLNIENKIQFLPVGLTGSLLVDANRYVFFNHNTNLNYTNQTLFELSSLTINRQELKNPKLIANLTLDQRPNQLKFNLRSLLVSSVKLNYNNYDQIKSGQFEIVDNYFQHKSTWTINDNLHLKMKLLGHNSPIANLVLLAENDYGDCDLKANYYKWNLNLNSKFKNEGRKLIFFKMNKLDQNDNPIIDHTTNVSVAVTNGFIKSLTYKDQIKKIDFDASIQGRDSSRIVLFVKDAFQFNLIFNPFIKNKFADLDINDDRPMDSTKRSRYLKARFEYDPKSFELNTNYFNEQFTFQKAREQSTLKLDFENLRFFGKCSHLITLNQKFKQYGLKQFDKLNSTKIAKQIDLRFVSKKEFSVHLDYDQLFKLKSDLNLNDRMIYLNLRKQSTEIEFRTESYNLLLLDYRNEEKQFKVFMDLTSDEYRLFNYVRKDIALKYDHETKIHLYSNYDLKMRMETIDRLLFEMNYTLWETFDLIYRRPEKEISINLIKNQLYRGQIKEKNELIGIEFSDDEQKVAKLFIKNLEFVHESSLIYKEPTKVYLIKFLVTHSEYAQTNRLNKVLNCELFISKEKESQLSLHYINQNLDVKVDPFIDRKINAIYVDKNQNLRSTTEFAYLGPQTYQLYSNVTIDSRMPFQLSLISVKKRATQFNMVSDHWHLTGEFNFLKLNKQTGIIKIRNDVENYFGNITLEANRKSFLIANYILVDNRSIIKGQANLTIAMISSEIVKFNYKDEYRVILTQLLWLGDRIVLNSDVNHTDYTHRLNAILSYDPSKTVKLNLTKTYNEANTLDGRLLASLTKPSYLYIDQSNFGNLNISIDLINKLDQKINSNYALDDQTATFYYLKQNSTVDSQLLINLQRLHPLLLVESSFNISSDSSSRTTNSKLLLLEPDYRSSLNSKFDLKEDGILFEMNTDSVADFVPKIKSDFILNGLATGLYSMNTDWLINNQKLSSTYQHKELFNLAFDKPSRSYQVKFTKQSNAVNSLAKRVVNGRATVLSFDLEHLDSGLNCSVGVEHLNRKTAFAFRTLNESIAKKRTLIFEAIFDPAKVYDLRIANVDNDAMNKRTITLNSPYVVRPLLIDFEKLKNNISLKWSLIDNQTQNNLLNINFKDLELNEMYKIVKTIVSYNDKEIVGLDLEKNFEKDDLTKLNVNFFNSTLKLEDTHEKLIFNLNDKDLNLQVNKEYLIHFESQLKVNDYNQKIIIYYDVQKKAISYQDFDLSSLRNLSTRLLIHPVPLTSTFISVLKTKDEINNEVFLFHLNTTDANRRKFVLRHSGIYLFSVSLNLLLK